MPINFNPALFRTGQKANTTVELVVGGEDEAAVGLGCWAAAAGRPGGWPSLSAELAPL